PSVAAVEGEGGVRVHPLINADKHSEAQCVLSIVREALSCDAHTRIAVLVNARTHVAAIARALIEAGIPCPAVEIEQLRERSVVREALPCDAHTRIAVLVNARTHVDAIARALIEADIPFQAVEIEQLRERPVVQDLMALTRALVHLADRTAWLSILRAPWCAL